MTTALLKSAEGETKVCGRTEYRTRDLWLINQMRYRLRYVARPESKRSCTSLLISLITEQSLGIVSYNIEVRIAQWVKRWSDDLAVLSSIPGREFVSKVNGVILHTAFRYPVPIVLQCCCHPCQVKHRKWERRGVCIWNNKNNRISS